jgi:hypothetical protein
MLSDEYQYGPKEKGRQITEQTRKPISWKARLWSVQKKTKTALRGRKHNPKKKRLRALDSPPSLIEGCVPKTHHSSSQGDKAQRCVVASSTHPTRYPLEAE